ncbi:uncharacterized protein LOC127104886 [Lathyrus oleraceus]|uniref:uncharacterized protein LOC127104886 n=1 Tax=Pisum sativum TaxID=3888 RepID=UPI0021D2A89F|nr:uncharacterized protein LOC127104886 [Pisum sativum]
MDSVQHNGSCLNSTFDFRVSDIQEDLYKFHQGTLDVSKYFTHLKVLWDELENHRPIPSCSCAIPRSCSVIASVRRYREQDYVIRFLKGLNEKFTHSKSQITMRNLLLDIDKAFSLVIQQEREVNNVVSTIIPSIGNNEESIALNAQASHDAQHGKPNSYRGKYQGANGPRGQNRVSTHCGRTNNTIDTCFIKHGFPPGFKNKSKCNGSGSHNDATINSASKVYALGSTTSSYGFTQEKYNNILALVQQSKLPPTANSISTPLLSS